MNKGKHRSPEEYTEKHPLTEKIDTFSLGNVLYSLLMRKDVYEGLDTEKAQEQIKKGVFIQIPNEVKEQFSPMEDAVAVAISMCHVKEVEDRSTSLEVESYLRGKLEEFGISHFD